METKQQQFLALTANEEFWDLSKPIIFLGEWCKTYQRKSFWQSLNAKTLVSPQLQYANSYEAYQYASNIYEALLPRLADKLNEIHSCNHSLKYWRLLVGPFLFWYSQVVYNRFLYLQCAYEHHPDIITCGISNESYLTPMNTNEFACFAMTDDSWNLQLFSQLIDLKFKKVIKYKKINWLDELKIRESHFNQNKYKLSTKIFLSLFELLNKLKRSQSIGILNSFLSKKDLFKLLLQSKFKIIPVFPKVSLNRGQTLVKPIEQENININMRKELVNIEPTNNLEEIILGTLLINMPTSFIETYKDEVNTSKKIFPYNSKVILQEQIASYDQYKYWMAEQVEKGAKLVSYQHGGCYGMQKASSAEFLECHVSDYFISWGWNFSKNVIPAPIPHALELFQANKSTEKKNDILWIATLYLRYCISIHDWPITSEPYLNFQKRFFSSLDEEITSKLCMRLNPSFNNLDEVKEKMPNLRIYSPNNRESFFEHLGRAKILVVDNPSTTFLYVLAFNIPTILFWDENHWIFRDQAKPYLELLRQVGIYHSTPESAAKKLNEIYSDPYVWWNSDTVQTAREEFCHKFARTSPDYLQEWQDLLLKLENSSVEATTLNIAERFQ